MAKYLKEFSTTAEYESYINNSPTLPNVSLTLDDNEVHYNQKPNYTNEYLTTTALENNKKIRLTVYKSYSSMTSISYSLDNGETWTTQNVGSGYGSVSLETPNLSQGDKVLWKGIGKYISTPETSSEGSFTATGNYKVSGNMLSLVYDDNFAGKTSFPVNYANFRSLFGGNSKLISAENLVLPATTLTSYCYQNMFINCTSLTIAPELPATTLATGCYQQMFLNCSSLTTAPVLPATTLANNCYTSMFSGCTSLTSVPELNATTLTINCYQNMFSGCTSLTTAPELPATTLVTQCYQYMFRNCTSLTTAPELPATTLANACYSQMFDGCTSLTTAPELPATTLTNNCYSGMFSGTNVLPDCSNIDFTSSTVVASGGLAGLFKGTKITDNDINSILPKDGDNKPCLPVTTLTASCYKGMFKDCTLLTTLPKLYGTTLATFCYDGMFNGCTGITTIPSNYLTATTLANYCYGDNHEGAGDEGGMFENCTSLTTVPSNLLPATTVKLYCYASMFKGCTSLTTVPSNLLPATTVGGGCYNQMFSGCTSLTTAPELPATTIATIESRQTCYNYMFYNCTSLTTAPELPATTVGNSSYQNMFKGCTNLNSITMLATTIPNNSLTNWVEGVAATGTFTKAAEMTTLPTGVSGIPSGWTVVDS